LDYSSGFNYAAKKPIQSARDLSEARRIELDAERKRRRHLDNEYRKKERTRDIEAHQRARKEGEYR
jgi:hypothetical protein